MTKTAQDVATPGSNITYSLSLANKGSYSATSVALNDPLPGTFVSARQVGGSNFSLTTPAVGQSGSVGFNTSSFLPTGISLAAPRSLTNLNGTLIFGASDSVHGLELWKSDGTAAGTSLLRDISPGSRDSMPSLSNTPSKFSVLGGNAFFAASNGSIGSELWKTDGTPAGTVLVKDINPGSGTSSVGKFAVVGSSLFFVANDGVNGPELWKSDGTEAGTVLVKDITPNSSANNFSSLTDAGGTLFFVDDDGVNGPELWKSDGTAQGTIIVKDINAGSAGSSPANLTSVGGTLFFTATDGNSSAKLWKSDGTSAGTTVVKDIYPGGDAAVAQLIDVNGILFFSANNGTEGAELWKSDGTSESTVLVKDINPGSDSSAPANLTNVNGTLCFVASKTNSTVRLWKTNGTAEGTVLLVDAPSFSLANVDGSLFFMTYGSTGPLLLKLDPASGNFVVAKEIPDSTFNFPSALVNVNGTLFFPANDGQNGIVLWKSDGTPAGTIVVKNINGPAYFEIVVKVSDFANGGTSLSNTATVSSSSDPVSSNNSATASTYIDSSQPGTSLLVTNLNDAGTGSLREAINTANSVSGDDVITFAPGLSGTITLAGSNLQINSNLSIMGPENAPIIINANQASRVLLVTAGRVMLRNLTLTGGKIGGGGYKSGPNDGGGIRQNDGLLIMESCTLSGNNVDNGYGGGMIRYGGVTNMSNCTVAGNSATGLSYTPGDGGGLDFEFGSGTISSCTITNNSAGGYGGGLFVNPGASVVFSNSIIASNTAPNNPDMFGSAGRSAGYNLIGIDENAIFTATGDKQGTFSKPMVARFALDSNNRPLLAFNGGPTKTVALLINSPALNAGQTDLLIDQRGVARPQGSADDIGALEAKISTDLSGVIISEFRLSGPNGDLDEFIELYNQTNTPLSVSGWSITGSSTFLIRLPSDLPSLPAYGHLLLTNTGYSLANYGGAGAATGDFTYTMDAPLTDILRLRNVAGTIVDELNSATLPTPTTATSNYSYVRRMDGTGGAPLDTGSDQNDFNLVDVQSTIGPNNTTGVSSGILRLGAPGPQNLGSPIAANQLIRFTQTGVTRTGSGNTGTLIVRATVQNLSSRALTALRFRTVGVTAGTAATSTSAADVRLSSSTSSDGVNLPLSLQNPPNQPNGGGLNATVSLGGLPSGGLAPGATVTVEFAFTIVKTGTFRYLLNLEPVTAP